jgi:hypothetical protein
MGMATAAVVLPGVSTGMLRSAEKVADTAKTNTIFRRGTDKESAVRLDRKSKEAEAAGFGHGVSGSKSDLGPNSSSASRAELEGNGFKVQDTPTKNNPDHVTIEMPNPVTKDDAARFNTCFGRGDCS